MTPLSPSMNGFPFSSSTTCALMSLPLLLTMNLSAWLTRLSGDVVLSGIWLMTPGADMAGTTLDCGGTGGDADGWLAGGTTPDGTGLGVVVAAGAGGFMPLAIASDLPASRPSF